MSDHVLVAIIAAGPGFLGAIIGAAITLRNATGAITERLVRVETKVDDQVARLDRVENKLDRDRGVPA